MPFANNGGNYHRRVGEDVVQSACGKSNELREALGATYMRDCFGQAIAGAYVKNWQSPTDLPTLDFEDIKRLLEEDVSALSNATPLACFWRTWIAQVYVSRPRLPERCSESTCRASWCPGLGNLH